MTAPKRRWLRFSLRTLFAMVTVVSVLTGWVVYQLSWIRQRDRAIENGEVGIIVSGGAFIAHPAPKQPPWQLRLFGAQAVTDFGLVTNRSASDVELERLRALFPETTVDRP